MHDKIDELTNSMEYIDSGMLKNLKLHLKNYIESPDEEHLKQ